MTPAERIRIIILIEKICKEKSYSEILGIEDISRFIKETSYSEEDNNIC